MNINGQLHIIDLGNDQDYYVDTPSIPGSIVGLAMEEPSRYHVADADCLESSSGAQNHESCYLDHGDEHDYPLGGRFHFAMIHEDEEGHTTPISATFEITKQSLTNVPYGNTLFPNRCALFFGQDPDSHTTDPAHNVEGIADHRGTVTMHVTDPDPDTEPNFDPIEVTFNVVTPTRLGTTHNAYDGNITTYADKSGIPPQYIKGQVERESYFDANAYRYEMRTIDITAPHNMDPLRIRMENGKLSNRYNGYLRPTTYPAGYENEGSHLNDDDRSAQDIYWVAVPGDDGSVSCDLAGSGNVSLRSLFEGQERFKIPFSTPWEDQWAHLCPYAPSQGWGDPTCFDIFNGMSAYCTYIFLHGDDYTAQTTAAASWGLLQVIYYDTAIGMQDWNGPNNNGQRNPSLLLDPDTSLELGTRYLVRKIALDRHHPCLTCNTSKPIINNYRSLKNILRAGFNLYNGSHSYGPSVLRYASHYPPIYIP